VTGSCSRPQSKGGGFPVAAGLVVRHFDGVRRSLCVAAPVMVAAAFAGACVGSVWASGAAGSAAAGRPPSPSSTGSIRFVGTFADPRWEGEIYLLVDPNGRRVDHLSGIAPGPCDDRDFGRMLPGRDGATGATFRFYPRGGTIRADGAFAAAGKQSKPRIGPSPGTVSVTGTFSGDVVRGRLTAHTRSTFDTCTANVAFVARRLRR